MNFRILLACAGNSPASSRFAASLLALLLLLVGLRPSDAGVTAELPSSGGFDAANRWYEQGRYAEAAEAYGRLIQTLGPSETLYYNLGNAWFKAGQTGKAIVAWRQAAKILPRDPSTQFNLDFARKKVAGNDHRLLPAWERALTALTLNEWTVCASGALWIWFTLLGLGEAKASLRTALRGYTATAGAVVLVLAVGVAAAANLQFNHTSAVVVVPDAIARVGPVDEAQVKYHYRDGTELRVLDQKILDADGRRQTWFQVQDGSRSPAWLKSDQVEIIR